MVHTEKIQQRKFLLEENVRRLVDILRLKYSPEKIILFGSLATGRINETSDLDMLVIKKTRKNFFRRLREIADLCDLNVGADILVYTPKEFEEESRNNPFFKEEIIKKGKVIYERAA